jgi:hypothetical protein
MSRWRDREHEMARFAIDEATAERLLTGALSPDDAPPAYSGVARLFEIASGPATETELATEDTVLAAALAALTVPPSTGPVPSPRKPRIRKLLTAKAAVVVATLALGASAAAAATTGNLPSGAQTAVSDALAHVDISVPKPNKHANANATASTHGKSAKPGDQQSAGNGPSANADFGLCTAFQAGPDQQANPQAGDNSHSGKDAATAFTALMLRASDAGKSTTAFCQSVLAAHAAGTDTSEPPTTNAGDHGQSGDHSQAGDHGKPADTGKPVNPGKPSDTPTTSPHAAGH